MSNTSEISSYEASQGGSAENGPLNACLAAVRWLRGESEGDRAAVERFQRVRREALLAEALGFEREGGCHAGKRGAEGHSSPHAGRPGASASAGISTVNLHLRDLGALLASAGRLGYRSVELPNARHEAGAVPPVLLQGRTGDRLAVARRSGGGIALSAAGSMIGIESIVRQHTIDRTLEHLQQSGMSVKASALPNGEVQIFARERLALYRGGAAEIRAQVRRSGDACVDVSGVKGKRCEEIVSGLARAVEARVKETRKKESYYALPGEPTRAVVKAGS